MVYGNNKLKKMLTGTVANDRLCHSYLFYGDDGLGKKTMATFFACTILCENDDKPCLTCQTCRLVQKNQLPDFTILDLPNKKDAIGIDLIREIRKECYKTPMQSRYRVYILPNVQNMTRQAFNAFLKILEETPPTSIFLLTASSKKDIAQTILSRCISMPLYPLDNQTTSQLLTERFADISTDEIENAVVSCNGNAGIAIDILNSDDNELYQLSQRIFTAIVQRNEYQLIKAFRVESKDRANMVNLLTLLTHKLRSILVDRYGANKNNPYPILTLSSISEIIDVLSTAKIRLSQNSSIELTQNWIAMNIYKILI